MNRQERYFSQRASFVKRTLSAIFLVALSAACLAFFTPGPIQRSSYMGAEYCGSCHQEEYKKWASSPHAKAHKDLPADRKNDRACLGCHATAVLGRNDPILHGVQCESCHGPGQYYAALHIKKDAVLSAYLFKHDAEKSCLHCHSSDSKLWSLDEGMKKIDHWSKVQVKSEHGAGVTSTMAKAK